jgi:PAS domain S-box-containing protein
VSWHVLCEEIVDHVPIGPTEDFMTTHDTRPRGPATDSAELTVGAVMSSNVVGVRPELSLDTLEAMMVEHNLSSVTVVDEWGRPVGMIAASDIVRDVHDRAGNGEDSPHDDSGQLAVGSGFHETQAPRTVADVMSPAVLELNEKSTVADAITFMITHSIHRAPVVGPDGRVVGMVSALDLLEATRGQTVTPEAGATAHLKAILRHAPVVLFALDRTGVVTLLEGSERDAFGVVLGISAGDLVGRSFLQSCQDIPELGESCRLALAGQEHIASFTTARGGRTYEARYEPVRDPDGDITGMIGVLLDVTDHKDAEARVARSHERLLEIDRLAALGSLAGGVAHQINNALTYARLGLGRLTSLELSRRPVTPVRAHRLELLQEVREGIARVERVITQLNEFVRGSDGPPQAIDLRVLMDSVIRVASHELGHRARLVCDYGDAPQVIANEGALRRALLNIVDNAAHSIPEGEMHLNEIRVVVKADDEGHAVVEIRDTGMGIAPDVLNRIFEPFFSTRPPGEGVGLGLSVAREIVSSMGGSISAESRLGKGTVVRLTLPPAGPGAQTSAQPIMEELMGEAKPRRQRRILIVDDDRPVAAAIALELELDDHEIVTVGSGREALAALQHDRDFDVVLCDLMMPEVSGIEVYEALKLVDPPFVERIVFMTGGAFTSRASKFLDEVPNHRLDKPFDPDRLRALINEVAQKRSGGGTRRSASAPPTGPHERASDEDPGSNVVNIRPGRH